MLNYLLTPLLFILVAEQQNRNMETLFSSWIMYFCCHSLISSNSVTSIEVNHLQNVKLLYTPLLLILVAEQHNTNMDTSLSTWIMYFRCLSLISSNSVRTWCIAFCGAWASVTRPNSGTCYCDSLLFPLLSTWLCHVQEP